MLDLVENICGYSRRKIMNDIMVHLDKARLHNLKKSAECLEQFHTRRVSHPAYSPDLAPSDFFFFGSVKSKMPGLAIRSREDLICEI
jgi:hypothetical protein